MVRRSSATSRGTIYWFMFFVILRSRYSFAHALFIINKILTIVVENIRVKSLI